MEICNKSVVTFLAVLITFHSVIVQAGDAGNKPPKKGTPDTSPPHDRDNDRRVNTMDKDYELQMKQKIDEARSSLEELRKKIEEWGVVTASTPIIMSVKNQFTVGAVSDFPTVGTYINNEWTKFSGASAVSSETGLSNQLGLSLQSTVQKNPVTGQTEPVLTSGTTLQTGTTPATGGLPPLNISNTLLSGSTAAPGGLLGSVVLGGIPMRSAVILGINDKIVEQMLLTMVNPPWDNFVNHDYDVTFAIIQVSCNPGWRTKYNYIADINASCDYYSSKSHKLMPESHAIHPLVFSVLPLLDAQNLDLTSSDRSVTSLAAQVNAAYPTIGLSILGQDLITFVHRYQKDNRTATPMTVTNSYSTGRTFGFRFAPSFLAQKDPALKNSQAADVLQATTIPVLVTVVTNRFDFKPDYDQVVVHFSNRWLINDRPQLTEWYRRVWTPLRRENYDERMKWAEDIVEVKNTLNDAEKIARCAEEKDPEHKDYSFDPMLSEMRDEALAFEAKTNSDVSFFTISEKSIDNTPEVTTTTTEPSFVPATNAFSLIIRGKWLNNVTQVMLGGKEATNLAPLYQTPDGDSALFALIPAGSMEAHKKTVVDYSKDQPVLIKSGTDASLVSDGTKLNIVNGSITPSSTSVDFATGTSSVTGGGVTPIAVKAPATGYSSTPQILMGEVIQATTTVTTTLELICRRGSRTIQVNVAPIIADKQPSATPDPKTLTVALQRDTNGEVTNLALTPSQFGFNSGSSSPAAPTGGFSINPGGIVFNPGPNGLTITSGTAATDGVSATGTNAADIALKQTDVDGALLTSTTNFQVTGTNDLYIKSGINTIVIHSGSAPVTVSSGTDPINARQGAGNTIKYDSTANIPKMTGGKNGITFIGGSAGIIITTNTDKISFPVDINSTPAGSSGSGAATPSSANAGSGASNGISGSDFMQNVANMVTGGSATKAKASPSPSPSPKN